MLMKKQVTIIAIAALLVSVSLVYCVEPTMGASDASLTTVPVNASHAGTSDQETPLTVSVGNASPSSVHASDQLGVSAASSAPANAVNAAATPSTITITTSTTNPAVNQPLTLSGILKAGTTPLSGRTITLSRIDPSGTWSAANTTTTDANGAYTFTQSESASGLYSYGATFSGDTYAPSNAAVSLTVKLGA